MSSLSGACRECNSFDSATSYPRLV